MSVHPVRLKAGVATTIPALEPKFHRERGVCVSLGEGTQHHCSTEVERSECLRTLFGLLTYEEAPSGKSNCVAMKCKISMS